MTNRILIAAVTLFFALGLAACEPEGPVEEAGEQIDQGIEETREAVEEGANEIGDAYDDAEQNQ